MKKYLAYGINVCMSDLLFKIFKYKLMKVTYEISGFYKLAKT